MMKNTVKQISELTGISVRTLHYYDEIGLLEPSEITEAGYRLYDEKCLEKLWQILFFRELEFPLADIKKIMLNPAYDKETALENHKNLLVIKRNRINCLIASIEAAMKGENKMNFKEFDMSEFEKAQKEYQREAEQRWGDTDSYKQSRQKTSTYNKNDWERINADAERIFSAFAANMDKAPDSPEVQKLVADWQNHITKYYYDCTKDILRGLGEMYIGDERFTKNIDKNGAGVADFMNRAIAVYCK